MLNLKLCLLGLVAKTHATKFGFRIELHDTDRPPRRRLRDSAAEAWVEGLKVEELEEEEGEERDQEFRAAGQG
jgi:hypothetical protein